MNVTATVYETSREVRTAYIVKPNTLAAAAVKAFRRLRHWNILALRRLGLAIPSPALIWRLAIFSELLTDVSQHFQSEFPVLKFKTVDHQR